MSRYASATTVSTEKSRAEIERILRRYGADAFSYGWEDSPQGARAVIMFRARGRNIRFDLPLPSKSEKRFWQTPSGRKTRRPEDAEREWEQGCRQRWRALALAVKAKLEVVESGIQSFEEEFMPYILLPDGRTVARHVLPAIERAYATGQMQRLLPAAMTGPDEDVIDAESVEVKPS